MKKMLPILSLILALIFCLTACGIPTSIKQTLEKGGVLYLSVNPKIAISYDADGYVTEIKALNDDGSKILADYAGYKGKPCKAVVVELVKAIGDAGYFIDDVDVGRRHITLELEEGSKLPSDKFLDEVAEEVRGILSKNSWTAPVEINDDRDDVDRNDDNDDNDNDDDIDDDVDDDNDDNDDDDDVDDDNDDNDNDDDDVDDDNDDNDDNDNDDDDVDDDDDDDDDDNDDNDNDDDIDDDVDDDNDDNDDDDDVDDDNDDNDNDDDDDDDDDNDDNDNDDDDVD